MRIGLWALACAVSSCLMASPARAEFFFCHAPSIAARGQGLILSQVFESRENNRYFVENAFKRFLQTTYAPYGNGWKFEESAVRCPYFLERVEAQNERMRVAGQVRRPEEELFNVPFIAD